MSTDSIKVVAGCCAALDVGIEGVVDAVGEFDVE